MLVVLKWNSFRNSIKVSYERKKRKKNATRKRKKANTPLIIVQPTFDRPIHIHTHPFDTLHCTSAFSFNEYNARVHRALENGISERVIRRRKSEAKWLSSLPFYIYFLSVKINSIRISSLVSSMCSILTTPNHVWVSRRFLLIISVTRS